MKIVDHRHGAAVNPYSRKPRLETLLSAWRFPRLAYWAERGVPPPGTGLTVGEMSLWLKLLRAAEPVPPSTHLKGLRIYARLRNRLVEDLEREKLVLVIGDQVAVRGQALGIEPFASRWSLIVPGELDGQETEAVLRKRFREMKAFGDDWLVLGSWFNCTDSVAALAHDALTATPKALVRLWQIAHALDLDYRFLPALPDAPAKELAVQLGAELAAAASHLSVDTDARLMRFALGRDDAPLAVTPLQLPDSRLARLLETDRFFERGRHGFGDAYYDVLASAFARLADPFTLGNVLLTLEAGSTLLSALEAVTLDQPEFIASYASHPNFHAEGAFTLLQLSQQVQLAQANQLDLAEEWLQAQRLARELLLLADRSTDWSSLVALGVHDESQAVSRRHYGVAPVDRRRAKYDGTALWAEAVSDATRGPRYVEALEKHFSARTRPSDAATIFALRLLHPLRESTQSELATRLATAIADAYVAALAPDAGFAAIPTVLSAYGALLDDLRASFDVSSESWQRFLRPFDPHRYLELALEDQSRTNRSTTSRALNVPRILRSHTETLVALASATEAFEEPLRAALELRDADRGAELHVGAFSWTQLARITSFAGPTVGDPLFVGIGRLFARLANTPAWLDDFLRNESEAHILAGISAGLGEAHPLNQRVRPKLVEVLDALLADARGIALGHALELANLLQSASMPRECEHFARRALTILDERSPRGHDAYGPVARALLAGALAQQRRWSDLLAFEPDRNLMVLSPHARSVENMRAVALMETGCLAEAEQALQRLLQIDASNGPALVNLTAIHLRARDWLNAIAAAEAAKEQLSPGEHFDDVLLNEAHAREKLGDRFGAARVLDGLTGAARTRPDVLAARAELGREDGASVPVPPTEVASGSPVDAPPLAALLGAVETATTATDKGRSLEELMARLFGSVARFEVDDRNVRTETEEIDLTILNGSNDPPFSKEGPLLLVECKNWSSNCGKNEFVIFKEKIRNRSQRCTVGFLISWNGFADTVTKEMLRGSREEALILLITGEQVRRAVGTGKFADELRSAWKAAVET